ncbi:hypothetical protein GALMADRAFT_886830 [Galerina marginata CBS 339.88]|uniref:Uncharacterized protein n=1 Tax=Galerina marginata (strain CBS 339.88) TaxID=685588 RepID=A0A067SGN6_GALM3|nr:hypothetical protein GALMADRAFT_886830 [Galerina marginata CBS 339.88]
MSYPHVSVAPQLTRQHDSHETADVRSPAAPPFALTNHGTDSDEPPKRTPAAHNNERQRAQCLRARSCQRARRHQVRGQPPHPTPLTSLPQRLHVVSLLSSLA